MNGSRCYRPYAIGIDLTFDKSVLFTWDEIGMGQSNSIEFYFLKIIEFNIIQNVFWLRF